MRILDFLTHPPFQFNLCKTGHEFHFAPSAIWREWDHAYRPWPGDNAKMVPGPLAADGLDLGIAATKEQYAAMAGIDIPKVFLSHTVLHPWDRGFFADLPPDVEIVYVSDHKRATFGDLGRRGRTIHLGVDTEHEFHGYTGNLPCVLNVTNAYQQQGDRGYGLFRSLTESLAWQVVGHGNESIPNAFPAHDFAHLRGIYRSYRCFLNTDSGGRLHLSLLEAMATGMPLVSLPIPELAPYAEQGVHLFMTDDERELRRSLELLLDRPDIAREVGQRGRELVQEHFGIERFVDEWNAVFAEVGERVGVLG